MSADVPHVLILGAGINGCAIARELALNGVGVCVVDHGDVASGATAYSSRLIHGGLRYLEYGEFDLVRESLAERGRLLRLAPQYVRPLELMIPVTSRFGGWWSAMLKFISRGRFGSTSPSKARGLWLVRMGLWLYDRYARDSSLPDHATHRVGGRGAPPVDRMTYRWLCSYWDAQVEYAERFTLALLEDARAAAEAVGSPFAVLTYHRARRDGRAVELLPQRGGGEIRSRRIEPDLIVNATGASVDRALADLSIESPPLMGPTKGSHFVTRSDKLIDALGGHGIYAEASDGRPVFVLPLGDAVLVGTTDVAFDGPPETAVASADELTYLAETVANIFPSIGFSRGDIDFHYCGVRPLPRSDAANSAGVTRRHALVEHEPIRQNTGENGDERGTEDDNAAPPAISVIGGKLTTCRALAETVVDRVLERLERSRIATTAERPLPGGESYPDGPNAVAEVWRELADRFQLRLEQVAAVWKLYGTRTKAIFDEVVSASAEYGPLGVDLDGCDLSEAVARWSIRHEWVRSVDDLVERRLMLLYHQRLTRGCLRRLAELLAEAEVIAAGEVDAEAERSVRRLIEHFGKRVF
ncbi:MAG: glycerol-3-phosphate dehydrogenase/oxidase [Pirellulales bacterium]